MISLMKSSQQIIKEIHNEFDTAQDRIMCQAEQILKELKLPLESEVEQKAKRLAAIGFVNTTPVKQAEVIKERNSKIQKQYQVTKETADLLKYYQQTYPFSKFLPESELDRICEKYNLIHAPVANYKMDVPEKNLKDIEERQLLLAKDSTKNIRSIRITRFWSRTPIQIQKALSGTIHLPNPYSFNTEISDHEIKKYLESKGIDAGGLPFIYAEAVQNETKKEGLFIAAPKNEFDLKDLKKEGKFGFKQIFERKIEDPIVFEYCRGGMIRVITKWGLEAEGKALTNEKMN